MALRVTIDRSGRCYNVGLRNDFAKYERDVLSGKIPSPFTVIEFKDTRYKSHPEGLLIYYSIAKDGDVVHKEPIPLTPAGKPKISLF